MKVLLEGVRTCWAHDAIIYDEKVVGFMQSCRQRKRWAQGQCDCGERFIPKLFARGIKTGNIRMLDGIVTLSQPFFMMASTIYAVLASINSYLPFYTNILNAIVPVQIWTIIGVGQYLIPSSSSCRSRCRRNHGHTSLFIRFSCTAGSLSTSSVSKTGTR